MDMTRDPGRYALRTDQWIGLREADYCPVERL